MQQATKDSLLGAWSVVWGAPFVLVLLPYGDPGRLGVPFSHATLLGIIFYAVGIIPILHLEKAPSASSCKYCVLAAFSFVTLWLGVVLAVAVYSHSMQMIYSPVYLLYFIMGVFCMLSVWFAIYLARLPSRYRFDSIFHYASCCVANGCCLSVLIVSDLPTLASPVMVINPAIK